ncbi:MAG: sulfite exporter TauE/SafE family protein [Bacteroidia bacterium]|nr:sulfite exporter TauE/SafE family protein [Bacteroidia bacterium]NNF31180.1 sulfite exporter TauE/SafE family protein [Flavobacteriaceae bacterium]MBT8274828.1 sulfite exporter TauE/SafE family protein [Bacteroidia bacterium]NNJ81376.1 sulfite exporter TauE/SafE family protein [Flavobacteriaceae bacterium]NNK54610.1 sulfite exporter TauE/SafE family protein [Flavobacteriaceae bacterium]
MRMTTILSLIIIGLLAGILSGFMGVGGGVIMIPLMILFLGYDQHQAQGMSLAVLAVPVTFVAAYTYHKAGHAIDWRYALVIALFFVAGGFLGSKFAVSLNQQVLKKIFALILVVAAVKLFFSK